MYKVGLFFFFISFSTIGICQTIIQGKVVAVTDGDTIILLTSTNKQIKIRLHGIDCPEKKQDYGSVAKQYTADLVFGKTVKAHVLDTDRYGRSVALIVLGDGRVLNEELLRAGLAWHYKQYDKSTRFASLELQARNKKQRIWSMSTAIAPWEYRKIKHYKPLKVPPHNNAKFSESSQD